MGRRVACLLISATFALGIGAALPSAATALIAWSLVGMPLTATASQATTFTLTATNFDLISDLGCVRVALPGSFQGVAAATPIATNGNPWAASVTGTTVAVYSLTGGGRLDKGASESVTVAITALPTAAGASTWASHAFRSKDCTGTAELGVAPLVVTVLPPPTPAPTPPPTPAPTPAPTPPGATPTPLPPRPTTPPPVPPSTGSPSTPVPTRAVSSTPSPSPRESSDPEPSAANGSGPSPRSPGSGAPGSSAGPAAGGSGAPTVRFDDQRLNLGASAVGLGAGVEIWAVPAATIAVPGLLVLLWVALQAAGALAWIPAARRFRSDAARRAGRR